MSLTKIIFLAMALGVVVGLLAAALGEAADIEISPALVGCVTGFLAVLVAGRRQPMPKKRR